MSCLVTSPFPQNWSVPRAITVYYRFPTERGSKDWCGGLTITVLCIKRAHTPIGLGSCQHLTQWMWAGPKNDHSCLVPFKNHWSWLAHDAFLIGLFTLSVTVGHSSMLLSQICLLQSEDGFGPAISLGQGEHRAWAVDSAQVQILAPHLFRCTLAKLYCGPYSGRGNSWWYDMIGLCSWKC